MSNPRIPHTQQAEEEKEREAYKKLTSDTDDVKDISLRTVIGGDFLGSRWFRKQLGFVALIAAMAIIYVTNRYNCQQEIINKKLLNAKLEDRRKRAVVAECDLTEFCRRSNIQRLLNDSTLRISNDSYYYLHVEKANGK